MTMFVLCMENCKPFTGSSCLVIQRSRVRNPAGAWVERDKLRERDRQARAQLSSQAERAEREVFNAPLFGVPVRDSSTLPYASTNTSIPTFLLTSHIHPIFPVSSRYIH
ncbi:hypothetical protein WDU94_011794 [Cyamophila willieti]